MLVLGEGLYQSENLPLFLLVLVGDFLATLALYIPYSLLPETAMAHGISQVHQKILWIRFKRSGFLSIFMRFVFLATLALYIPPTHSHGTWYITGPSKTLELRN